MSAVYFYTKVDHNDLLTNSTRFSNKAIVTIDSWLEGHETEGNNNVNPLILLQHQVINALQRLALSFHLFSFLCLYTLAAFS